MKHLFFYTLIFILSACGSDSSNDNNPSSTPVEDTNTTTTAQENNTNTTQENNTNDTPKKEFPYGTYQSICLSFGMYTSIPAYDDKGLILQEIFDKENKKHIQHAFVYNDRSCTTNLFKLSSYDYFTDNIEYDSNKDLYKVKLFFIKQTHTAASTSVANGWNESNYMGINTWADRAEIDTTGRNADGSTFTPESISYKIIKLSNEDTQLIQNENPNTYPESLDYGYVFFKKNY